MHKSVLVPEIFQYHGARVRVCQPKAILLDFHGTLSERHWEERVVFPYVRKALASYLKENWALDAVQKCIPSLKHESFEQRFRNRYDDAPVIDDQVDADPRELALQMSEFVGWQLDTKRQTRESYTIERLVWEDGFRKRHILTPIYEDVMPRVREWRESYKCSIYVVSSLEPSTLELLFKNTSAGNLHQLLDGYLSPKKAGDKLLMEAYSSFKGKILAGKKEDSSGGGGGGGGPIQAESSLDSSSGSASSTCPPAFKPRPILFLTDSGQEAQAASRVDNGTVYECLLVNRPTNKIIRSFYLSQFQYINKLDDIEFVAI